MVAVHGCLEWDKLVHACMAISHVLSEPSEVCEGFMDAFGKRDPFALDVAKGFLYLAEKSSGSGEGDCHGAQFDKDTVPLVYAYPELGARY